MIARVADHCFWFGRYLERAESTARLLQATRSMVFDAELPVTQCWTPLVIVSGEYESFCERFGPGAAGDGETVQEHLTWSEEGVSLLSSVRAARQSARVIRETLSSDAWEAINELYLLLTNDSSRALYDEHRDELYRQARRSTQLVLGLVRSTMLHEEPMSFLWLGTMIERAGQMARMLDMHHHTLAKEHAHIVVQTALWLSLLRASSGYEAFMKRHQGRVTAQSLIAFLVWEPGFPRSLRYCLKSARSILTDIWPERDGRAKEATQRLDTLLRWLDEQRAHISEGADVHGLLTRIVDEASAICNWVSATLTGAPALPAAASAAG